MGRWKQGSGEEVNLEARKGKRDFIFIVICPSQRQLENPTGFLVYIYYVLNTKTKILGRVDRLKSVCL